MSKLQVKQQKEKNENNLRDLNTKPEKFLNKKWSRNDTLTNKYNNNANKKNKVSFNPEQSEEFKNTKKNLKKKGKEEKEIINVKKIDHLTTKDSSGSNNTSEPKENKIMEKKYIQMPNPKNRIYINPIKASFTKDELINYFKKCGNIIDTNIDEEDINSSEKVIYIDFKSKNAVNKALKKNGTMFKGEKIIVKDYLESDINIENLQKNIEIKLNDVKSYIDNEFTKFQNFFETKLKEANDELDKTKNKFSKKLKNLNIKLGLTNEIINQSEIYNNGRHEYLNSKINMLLKSFKVLYNWKIDNLLLKKVLTKYKKKFYKKKQILGKNVKFGIIIADKDINKISKNKINQLIYFFKPIKKIASQIIHFNNLKKIKAQKKAPHELLKTYLEKKMKNILD